MTDTSRDFDRALQALLDAGPDQMSDRLANAIATDVHQTPQRGFTSPWRFPHMNRFTIAAAATLIVVAVAGLALVMNGPSRNIGTSPQPTPTGTSSASPKVSTASPTANFQLDQNGGTAFANGSVWMAGGDTLLRIDPHSGKTVATIRVGGIAKFVFAGAGSIWVSRAGATDTGPATTTGTVRVDPATNRVTARVPFGVAFGFGSLWGIDQTGRLLRGDPATGQTTAALSIQPSPGWQPQVAVGFNSVWVASGDKQTVYRIDPRTMRITSSIGPFNQSDSLLSLGIGFGSVWADANAAAADGGQGTGMLYRIDPTSNRQIAAIPVGDQLGSGGYGATVVGIGDGSVWTGDSSSTISRIDPATNKVVAFRPVLVSLEFIAAGDGSLWVNSTRFDEAAWAP